MQESGHLYGGGTVQRKYKLGAAAVDAGIVMIGGAGTSLGVIPCTTTSFADAMGLAMDEVVYTTSQATVATGTGEAIVSVSARPDLIIKALMNQGATESTALTTRTITSADTAGTTLTMTVGSNDADGGIVWCTSGANVGQSRGITAHTSTTSFTVTVPFARTIAVGDTFLYCPWNPAGTGAAGADGIKNVQTTTLFTQADADIAAGTGGEVCVVDLTLQGASDSYVHFVQRLHVAASAAIAS